MVKAGTPSGIHYLSCSVCRWSSLEIGLKFERPTGLAMQMQKMEEETSDFKEFEHLRDHFDRLSRRFTATASSQSIMRSNNSLSLSANVLAYLPSLGNYATGVTAPNKALSASLSKIFASEGKGGWEIENYKQSQVPELGVEEELVANTVNLKLEDGTNLKPQRIQLRSKRSKRCRKCDHILIKPEQKAIATRFKIKQMALDFLPSIVIAQLTNMPPLPVGVAPHGPLQLPLLQTAQLNLRFTNPLDQEMKIELSTTFNTGNPAETGNCEVTILAPTFIIPPFNDLMDYDDEDIQGAASGIVEIRGNSVVVAVLVVPKRGAAEEAKSNRVEFPLLVRFTRQVLEPIQLATDPPITGYSSATSSTSSLAAEPAPTRPVVSPGANRQMIERSDSFWCMVGVGEMKE
ncbi:hypothetical protein HDU67_000853 [Dinochytrium kinnereticum]|nr:hypothetical protein HDU67_000853 [Dinochytrium kinnereticum]